MPEPNDERGLEMVWSDELAALRRDAERYRKLRASIKIALPGTYITSQRFEVRDGEELDCFLDTMESEDAKPE